jgi:hypothetical protein
MAAGIADHVSDVRELLGLLESFATCFPAPTTKRRPGAIRAFSR